MSEGAPQGEFPLFLFYKLFLVYQKEEKIMAVKYVFVTEESYPVSEKELPQLPWEDC